MVGEMDHFFTSMCRTKSKEVGGNTMRLYCLQNMNGFVVKRIASNAKARVLLDFHYIFCSQSILLGIATT